MSELESSMSALSREVARLRRLVLLLVLPWPLVLLTSFADDVQDEVVTRKLVVVDEQGVTRAALAAPTIPVRPTFHAEPVPTSLPSLRSFFGDGTELLVGATEELPQAQVRVSRGEWWTGLRTSGLFATQAFEGGGQAVTNLGPFRLTLERTEGEDDRSIELELFGEDDHPEITVTEGEHETVFPPR